jgi:protein-S-isoprenylcysteine O-methyltransferase Ste14
MNSMNIANFVAVVICLGMLTVYAVAARTQFVSPEGVPARMRLIAALFLLFGAANARVLAVTAIDLTSLAPGLILHGVAAWLFSLAVRANRARHLSVAFTTDVPEHLVSSGPYRYIRHPFYTSYCLTWLASAVVAHSVLLLGSFGCMMLLYRWAARFEERKFSESGLASEYRRYRANTGMFIPSFRRMWRDILNSNEVRQASTERHRAY